MEMEDDPDADVSRRWASASASASADSSSPSSPSASGNIALLLSLQISPKSTTTTKQKWTTIRRLVNRLSSCSLPDRLLRLHVASRWRPRLRLLASVTRSATTRQALPNDRCDSIKSIVVVVQPRLLTCCSQQGFVPRERELNEDAVAAQLLRVHRTEAGD